MRLFSRISYHQHEVFDRDDKCIWLEDGFKGNYLRRESLASVHQYPNERAKVSTRSTKILPSWKSQSIIFSCVYLLLNTTQIKCILSILKEFNLCLLGNSFFFISDSVNLLLKCVNWLTIGLDYDQLQEFSYSYEQYLSNMLSSKKDFHLELYH